MKILFLAPANNYHTIKWSNWFSNNGHDVYIISLVKPDNNIKGTVYYLQTNVQASDSDIKKIKYLSHIRKVKKIINDLCPDIINAHYVTSYGLLAALSGVKKFIVSAWGSDVYDFPRKSIFHKLLLKYILKKSSFIFSTSNAMATEIKKYTSKEIFITPFGVDVSLFNPKHRCRNDKSFIIGTVKTLSPKYGIETLLEAVYLLRKKHPNIPLKVRIAGKGEKETQYKIMARNFGLSDCITWLGFITQEQAAIEWANFDCAIIPSMLDSESFGVSAVEAQSCECPVIISDVPGLMESTSPNLTSAVFPRGDSESLSEEIYNMYSNYDYRITMGKRGREYVEKNYELNSCFIKIEKKFLDIAK